MSEKLVVGRIQQKRATAAEWAESTLVPLEGEIIIYEADDTIPYPRLKVGDGVSLPSQLPFFMSGSYVFSGTTEEYNAANESGLIPVGSIVIITDDDETEATA